MTATVLSLLRPDHCEYAAGPCDQDFSDITTGDVLFLYAADPPIISTTIESAIELLRKMQPEKGFRTWRDLNIAGQIIFCQICKAIRGASAIVADVTTLNFNVLFEIGYAIGLGIPVIPIRDPDYAANATAFGQLGLIDTIGYKRFNNSEELANALNDAIPKARPLHNEYPLNTDQPLYVIKSSIGNEGQIKLISALDKSSIPYRTFDPQESSRMSIHDAVRNAIQSRGIVASLIAPERPSSLVDNARCAIVAGVGMAAKRHVLMIQENVAQQPIDYRDVVQHYTQGQRVTLLVAPFIKALLQESFGSKFAPVATPLRPLEQLDFGDIAAENEINQLREYFVPTSEYSDVKRGHARLVVGRKGSGKTAILYEVVDAFVRSRDYVVVDLKPEAHQFTEFRTVILRELEAGAKEHVLTAFWHYLLLIELARKIIEADAALVARDTELAEPYQRLVDVYGYEGAVEEGDFSERLYELILRITEKRQSLGHLVRPNEITELIYEKNIHELNEALAEYLSHKEAIWLLVDNLDKGWPVGGIEQEDILLILCLLEAARKIQRQLARKDVDTRAVVFLRNDVFDLLLPQIRDKGKETTAFLDWDDVENFKKLAERRMAASSEDRPFDELWPMFFPSHVGAEESFHYILSRTLMRPRDLIRFLKACVNIAVNRGHERVTEEDVLKAEEQYSEDQTQELAFEVQQIYPEYGNLHYAFIGAKATLHEEELFQIFRDANIDASKFANVTDVLLWFGFLGVASKTGKDAFAYEYRYGIERLKRDAAIPAQFVVHPAFRRSLGIA